MRKACQLSSYLPRCVHSQVGTHKCSNHGANPRNTGLLNLADGLREFAIQRLVQRLADLEGQQWGTVRFYGLLDTGLQYKGVNPATGWTNERCLPPNCRSFMVHFAGGPCCSTLGPHPRHPMLARGGETQWLCNCADVDQGAIGRDLPLGCHRTPSGGTGAGGAVPRPDRKGGLAPAAPALSVSSAPSQQKPVNQLSGGQAGTQGTSTELCSWLKWH